ncbi:putative UDP-glycosyltransferase 91A1-like [Capsicum annuum]|nr:putative UDP-glycosyltransferase 91A1-like [Capsicum annuum]
MNARLLEEKKIAYSIPRNDQDGSFTRDAVAKSLSLVLIEKDGEIYGKNVKEKHDRLPKLAPNLSQFLKFVKLPLPKLPENAEATINVPYEQVKYLKIAHDGLEEPMAKFLEDSAPDFILFDFASYWIPSLASKFNIPTAYFSIFIAAVLSTRIVQ